MLFFAPRVYFRSTAIYSSRTVVIVFFISAMIACFICVMIVCFICAMIVCFMCVMIVCFTCAMNVRPMYLIGLSKKEQTRTISIRIVVPVNDNCPLLRQSHLLYILFDSGSDCWTDGADSINVISSFPN